LLALHSFPTRRSSDLYTVQPDGTIIFTPEREFFGESSIRYVVSDVNGLSSDPATITVTVARSQPQAVNDHAETAFNTPVQIPVRSEEHTSELQSRENL